MPNYKVIVVRKLYEEKVIKVTQEDLDNTYKKLLETPRLYETDPDLADLEPTDCIIKVAMDLAEGEWGSNLAHEEEVWVASVEEIKPER